MTPFLRRWSALVPLVALALFACDSSTEPIPIDDPDPAELVPVCASPLAAVSSFLGIADPGDDPAAAVDFFLKLEGIDGESEDSAHEGEIDVLSWSWGASVRVHTFAAGGGVPEVSLGDLILVKEVDASSSALEEAAASGETISEARLAVRAGGSVQSDYLTVTLENVIITSVARSDASSDLPTEQVSLNFGKVEWQSEREPSCAGAGDALAAFLSPPAGGAAARVDGYLKFPDIPGESQEPGHEDEIDILSFSLNTSFHLEAGPPAARTGTVYLEDIIVVKELDKASPLFRDAAAAGTTYGSAVLSCRKAGGDEQVEYVRITLEDVLVSSYQPSSDETPTESVSLSFAQIKWEG